MIMASDPVDDVGSQIDLPEGVDPHAFLFGEDQARYLVALPEDASKKLLADAKAAGVPAMRLGVAGGRHYRINDLVWLEIGELRAVNERFFPALMGAPLN